MPLPLVYYFNLVHVSLVSWLNFTNHVCKMRNVLNEKNGRLRIQNKIGCIKKILYENNMDNNWALKKNKKWGKGKKIGYLGYKEKNAI